MARCMTMAGVRPGMVVHNANGYGLFTGGLGFHDGARADRGDGDPGVGRLHARGRRCCCRDLGGQVLTATPSYALVIAQAVRDAGHRPGRARRSSWGCSAASRGREAMREQIERELGLTRGDVLRPVGDVRARRGRRVPAARDGLHVQEDHFLVEVVDPDSGEPLGRRRGGRAGVHDARQGGAAADPLPHRRHRLAGPRAVRVRAHARAHDQPARAARRHADRARREPVPVERRAPAARRRGGGAALPADRGARRARWTS